MSNAHKARGFVQTLIIGVLVCFLTFMMILISIARDQRLKKELNRMEAGLHASKEMKDFWDGCRARTGEWVKVECGESVMRCVHLEIKPTRINRRESVIVGPALRFCRPTN